MGEILETELREQVEKAKMSLRERGYSGKTIEGYSGVWHHLLRYAERECIADTAELLTRFAMLKYGIRDKIGRASCRERV